MCLCVAKCCLRRCGLPRSLLAHPGCVAAHARGIGRHACCRQSGALQRSARSTHGCCIAALAAQREPLVPALQVQLGHLNAHAAALRACCGPALLLHAQRWLLDCRFHRRGDRRLQRAARQPSLFWRSIARRPSCSQPSGRRHVHVFSSSSAQSAAPPRRFRP